MAPLPGVTPPEGLLSINLLGGTGLVDYDTISSAGFATSGALPIQTSVSPHGKFVVTANTLTATITIIDTDTDELIQVLPCSAGCHGVNFGAKQGGGYYAYVSSKFSNDLLVVEPDPNNNGNASDATLVGRVVLVEGPATGADDTVSAYAGMGARGFCRSRSSIMAGSRSCPHSGRHN
jgi:hypothetical protein